MSGHPGFCPACFAPLAQEADTCPACGARMTELSSRDYREKLVHALLHPLADVRMRAIIALGLRGEAEMAEALVECAMRHPTDVVQGLEIKLPPAKPEVYCLSASKARVTQEPSEGGYSPNFIWS